MNLILLSIIKKEFHHILRDPQTLTIIIFMPVMMLFLFGYAITLEMKQIETAIIDEAKSNESRAFIEQLMATDFFRITSADVKSNQIETIFKERKARCALIIPYDFSSALQRNKKVKIQLLVDASDPNAANFINNYVNQLNLKFNLKNNADVFIPFSFEPVMLYNPDLKSYYFFVPGLIAVILLLISALLTSIAIVREKERGTMEQILVSPVSPIQIIIGKTLPYTALGFLDSIIILLFGCLWFGVPLNGPVLLLGFSLILYIITGLSFGLLVSTISKTQQVAMLAALLATILPTIMLSGFIFPVASMPLIFQYLSLIVPATHFLEIIRGIMLKGIGLKELYIQLGYLFILTAFLIALSIKKFSRNLEG
ncbi:MAG: ABC transporter permease [Calditrichaceae bacterium]|nr:ABC transporter permease [Calditrichaceae bacterium]MBN2708040.1 ABC transporter permease [Calditrichaceae bacterium]RQV95163.1 MAG: ABC transporter permease [Calditrichota bacterium]